MRKVGIYGGTFDPFHFGHLSLVVSMREAANLDEVWLLPASQSPLRKSVTGASFKQRLSMVEVAVKEVPYLFVKGMEGERKGPSYTVDTIKLLKERESESRLSLIIGDDVAATLHLWHQVDELIDAVDLLVGDRETSQDWKEVRSFPRIWQAIEKGRIRTPRYDISATDVRKRLFEKRYCGHLLPAPIIEYIKQNKLYQKDFR